MKAKTNQVWLKKRAPRHVTFRRILARRILAAILSNLLFFDGSALAMVAHLSPNESTPEFWLQASSTRSADQAWNDMRDRVLHDESNRIGADFKIQDPFRKRTEFWFDIYTRYGSSEHVIHHTLYPWIVFQVMDVNDLVAAGKGPLWLRRDRAEKSVTKQAVAIRRTLRKLARRKSYDGLTGLEKELFEKLESVPGSRRKVLAQAARYVRVQLGQRDFFRGGLVNSSRYLPYMEEKFQEAGLPMELTRLPFVESSFNEKAYSKVGASGVWQIMPQTGRNLKLIVGPMIDERNSPIKATETAARLLKQIQRSTKSWDLTITAWNHGIGNIRRAIRKAHSQDLATIISRYHGGDFKFASANFYSCFLAALHAEKYNELVFNDIVREPLQEHEIVYLNHRTSISRIQKLTGMSRQEILAYNLDLKSALSKRANVLPRGFELHVPKGTSLPQVDLLGSHQISKFRQTSI
jgi:membrane-bound lytic murein transglycosylase D